MKTRPSCCLVIGPMDRAEALKRKAEMAAMLEREHATDQFCVDVRPWRDGGYQVWLYEYVRQK